MNQQHALELNDSLESYTVRKVFYDMMKYCGAFSQNYNSDPYLTNFLIGRRNVGLWLMSQIEEAGDEWLLQIMREGKKREQDMKEINGTDISD